MSHSDFKDWILELNKQVELFEIALQTYNIPITHSRLRRIGWQLRLANPTVYTDANPEFVPADQEDFMAKPPSTCGWSCWS